MHAELILKTSEGSAMPIGLAVFLAVVFWGTWGVLKLIERKRDRS